MRSLTAAEVTERQAEHRRHQPPGPPAHSSAGCTVLHPTLWNRAVAMVAPLPLQVAVRR